MAEGNEVKGKFNAVPEQILAVVGLVITGTGLTVTVIVYGVPKQPFRVGVTV